MPSCHEMKNGEIYVCKDCGIELQVVNECRDVGTHDEECACHTGGGSCSFSCCGGELVKKE